MESGKSGMRNMMRKSRQEQAGAEQAALSSEAAAEALAACCCVSRVWIVARCIQIQQLHTSTAVRTYVLAYMNKYVNTHKHIEHDAIQAHTRHTDTDSCCCRGPAAQAPQPFRTPLLTRLTPRPPWLPAAPLWRWWQHAWPVRRWQMTRTSQTT